MNKPQLTEMEKVKALADKAGLCPSQKFDYLSRNEKRAIKTKLKKMKLNIKNPFKTLAENYEKSRRKEAIAQVNRCVQLREFEEKIWLCYNDVPIVEQSQLKDTLCNTITDTRAAVCRYFKLTN